jgi:hypothetical protein
MMTRLAATFLVQEIEGHAQSTAENSVSPALDYLPPDLKQERNTLPPYLSHSHLGVSYWQWHLILIISTF